MTARCHNCGREYLTARALAGKPVACRSCGALNDGAGGPPPAQPEKRVERERREAKPLAGASFSVGTALPRTNADADELAAREAIGAVPNPERVNLMNRAVFALGIGAALLSVLVIAGLFVVRAIETNPDSGRDWTVEMLATPQVVTDQATGSGFLVEVNRELWLVTNLHVLEGAEEVDAIFPDPKTGTELFRIADRRIADFRVHKRVIDSYLDRRDAAYMDLAVLNVEQFRDNLTKIGSTPLPVVKSDAIRTGQPAYALGHPATAFAFGDESKDESTNTARHTLTAGLISSVRQDPNRPILVQTDAAINSGNSGGPLLSAAGEVLAVNTWRDVELKGAGQAESKQGMAFSLATNHVLEVIATGPTVRELRKGADVRAQLNTGTAPTLQTQSEETGWPTFATLGTAFGRARGEGWNWTSRQVLATGPDGRYAGVYRTLSSSPTDVLILALPKLAAIDLDLTEVANAAGGIVGKDDGPQAGVVAEVRVEAAQHTGSLSVEIGTFASDRGVPAEFVVLIFERAAGGANSPGATPPPGVPPAPVAPPNSPAPSPGQPQPQPIAPPRTGSVASMVELRDGMSKTVYASSLIGLREFDLRFLTNSAPDEAFDAIEQAFVDATPNLVDGDPKFARDIMEASLLRSYIAPAADRMTLFQSRPLFEALLEHVPTGVRVGVYLEFDSKWSKYLSVASGGLVSKSADIKLEQGGLSDAYRHDTTSGLFRVPLDLPWNYDELRGIEQAIDVPYTLIVRYDDGSDDRMSGRIHVNPVTQVERAYPFGISFASMVDETHPWIKRIMDEINQRPDVKAAGARIAGGGGSPQARLESIYLLWQDFVGRGLRYQNLTAADGIAQRCRLLHESISSGNANCIDGTVLLASFLEAMGIQSYIVLLPGHALVCADCGNRWFYIETTAMGEAAPRDPPSAYDADFHALRQLGKFYQTPELDSLELACDSGLGAVADALGRAQQVLTRYRSMAAEFEQRSNDAAWQAQFWQTLEALAQQIQIVPVSLARQNGVRPVGAPADLDQQFRIPKRR